MFRKLGMVLAGVIVLVVVVSLLLYSDQIAEHRIANLNTQPAGKSPVGVTDDAVTPDDSSNDVPDSDQIAEDGTADLAALEPKAIPVTQQTVKSGAAISATIRSEQDFVTSKDVVQLEPLGIDKVFAPGRVYVFARVFAPKEESLTLKWYDGNGKEFSVGQLKVNQNLATGYRIYTWKTLMEAGSYEVRLFNSDQVEMGRRQFNIADLNTQPAGKSPVGVTDDAVTAGDSSTDAPDSDQIAEDGTADLAMDLAALEPMAIPVTQQTVKSGAANSATIRSEQDFVTSKDVVQLEPLGIDKVFAPGRVYVFARVFAPKEESLTLKWYDGNGKEFSVGQLKVNQNLATGYRIYTWKTLMEAGPYEVRLFNSDQVEMGRRQFNISET